MSVVNVAVPEEHLMAVYKLLGRLASEATSDPEAEPIDSPRVAWNGDLVGRAVREGDSHKLADALRMVAESGDGGVTTEELGAALGYERGAQAVAGMLGAAHRRFRNTLGVKQRMWHAVWEPFNPGPGGTSRLTLDPLMRSWVLQAMGHEDA